MRVQVNGEVRDVLAPLTLQELLVQLSIPGDRVAIELNHKVVRRAEWTTLELSEDDRVEIVHFVGGGVTSRQTAVGGSQ